MEANEPTGYLLILNALRSGATPPEFTRLMKVRWSTGARSWMEKRNISEEDLAAASWRLFIIVGAISSAIILLISLSNPIFLIALVPGALLSLLIATLFNNHPEGISRSEEGSYLRNSPGLISCLSMSLQLEPSLERAVAFATQASSEPLFERLKESVWTAMIASRESASTTLLSFATSLSERNGGLRQAIHLIISAASERTKEGVDRLLDKANAIVLAGIREAADRFTASLSVPTMVLFSMGILLPVMLFSLLPLMSIGSASTESTPLSLDPAIALLIVVLFPLGSFAYARSILLRNPINSLPELRIHIRPRTLAIMAIAFAGSLAAAWVGGILGAAAALLIAILPLSILIVFETRAVHSSKRDGQIVEENCISVLYQIGNRMISGSNLEKAWEEVINERRNSSFGKFGIRILYLCRLGGRPMDQIIKEDGGLRQVSPLLEGAFSTVADCARRDPASAGKVALNLAQYLSDIRSCRAEIEVKLRGMIDMMKSTSLIFGPIVFGVTCSLFGVISLTSSEKVSGQLLLIVGTYLVELSFIVSYFTVFLSSGRGWKEVMYQFGTKAPVSATIFILVFIIARMGLTSLL